MRTQLLFILFVFATNGAIAQNVGIGSTTFTPNDDALLELRSTTSGFLLPKMTEAQKNAIVGPTEGLLVYQTNAAKGFKYFNGSSWAEFGGAADNFGDHVASQNIRLNNHWLSNDGGNEGIRIDNNGNIGIGTSTPDRQLNVGGTSGARVLLTREDNTTQSSDLLGELIFDSTDDTSPSTVDGSAVIRVTASENHGNSNKGGNMSFLTKPTGTLLSNPALERMTITHNGRVGIGTTNPSKTLDVVSNTSGVNVISVQNTQSNGWSSIDFNDQDGSLSTTFGFANSGTSGIFTNRAYMNSYNHDFVLTRNSSEYSIFISGSNGNVGLGTNGPSAKLDVNGSARVRGLSGSGTRMVVVDSDGTMSTQSIPSAGGGGGFGSGSTLNLNVTNDISNLNVAGVSIIRLDANNSSHEIKGITGGVAGQVICIVNTDSSHKVKFKKDEGVQRFRDDLEVSKKEGAIIMYDGVYWYVLSRH